MSFMKGDLLAKTRKLVKGLAKAEPVWLKAMENLARVFAWRVLDLKEQGANEEEAMLVADMEYRVERKGKKKAYARLKQIARLQGKRPPPNPYPSAVKEIQVEEKKFVRDRFYNPHRIQIVQKLKQDKAQEMMDRRAGGFLGS
ncbi:hypothetical protein BUALT_Bualt06G0061900 [Buddleja alternifolia]|uniref:Uncharacterized protein n=1 Tax=Buddleja alternifolia TaxID=168488 RepID=A0AAV6XNZ9_9LAMI|nr:hypothetical protein BUALT_Bualt06G0061900 [Buddleja alternifolia]